MTASMRLFVPSLTTQDSIYTSTGEGVMGGRVSIASVVLNDNDVVVIVVVVVTLEAIVHWSLS